ncbi:hypothetical protein [Streptomyces zagrosensis]|uniref:Uncharacterized protein n=1 Tax=Streptomyces zagrosensis TaxID=1042984 RepID=A0A7W9V217_9ACTN|nr:hypothetical protein [Streptomyces zagrosensis]MBB5939873.1 hypothetical protein [Streptomyces zagrosensis]
MTKYRLKVLKDTHLTRMEETTLASARTSQVSWWNPADDRAPRPRPPRPLLRPIAHALATEIAKGTGQ